MTIFALSLQKKHVRVDGPFLNILLHPLDKKAHKVQSGHMTTTTWWRLADDTRTTLEYPP